MCSRNDPTFAPLWFGRDQQQRVQTRYRVMTIPGKSRSARAAGGEGLDPRGRVARDDGVGDHCPAAKARAPRTPNPKKSPGSKRSTICRRSAQTENRLGTSDDPVPAFDATLLWVDLLVPLIPRQDSERLQCLRYRSRAPDTLVRPHRFTDIQASSIGVHFSSSIVHHAMRSTLTAEAPR
jgi:hypothetical protein